MCCVCNVPFNRWVSQSVGINRSLSFPIHIHTCGGATPANTPPAPIPTASAAADNDNDDDGGPVRLVGEQEEEGVGQVVR